MDGPVDGNVDEISEFRDTISEPLLLATLEEGETESSWSTQQDPQEIVTEKLNSSASGGKTSYEIHVKDRIEEIKKDPSLQRAMYYKLAAATLIGINTGYVNGVCLNSAFMEDSSTQNVAGNAGSITNNAIALININEEKEKYLYCLWMLLSYMGGSLIVSIISPRVQKFVIEPRYGPTFFVGATLLLLAGFFAHYDRPSRFVFFLATASLGVQNGISSIYSGNLIRCTLTGATTDIALVIGQVMRGNFESINRGFVLGIIVTNFWIGSLISVPVVGRMGHRSLLLITCVFYLLGILCVVYLRLEMGVPIWRALLGTWGWDQVLEDLKPGGDNGADWDIEDFMDIFTKADTDDSKTLSSDELRFVLERAHHMKLTQFQLNTLFRAADTDGNEEISEEEWRALGTKLLS